MTTKVRIVALVVYSMLLVACLLGYFVGHTRSWFPNLLAAAMLITIIVAEALDLIGGR